MVSGEKLLNNIEGIVKHLIIKSIVSGEGEVFYRN